MVATAPCLLTYFLYVEQLSFLLGISAASVMRVAPVANSLNGLIEYRKGGRGNV